MGRREKYIGDWWEVKRKGRSRCKWMDNIIKTDLEMIRPYLAQAGIGGEILNTAKGFRVP
jgi:hypothetical protein